MEETGSRPSKRSTSTVLPAAGGELSDMLAQDQDLSGIWFASQTPRVAIRYVLPPSEGATGNPIDQTMHYILVVRKAADGTLTAFIRNPEANAGAQIGTRVLQKELPATANADGTLTVTLKDLPQPLQFHRATADEQRWYYPRATATWKYVQPQSTADGWPVGSLASQGMRAAPIAALMQGLTADRAPALRSPYIHSISIARHGKLVLDEYFNGFDETMLHDTRSASKSVTTLLVGRAIEDTHTFTPDSKVLDVLNNYRPPANDDARKEAMTVANLMTMSSGLACDDNDDNSPGGEDTMQSQTRQPDWYKYTLDLPMASAPGTRALYCTAGINLLGAIVARSTQEPLTTYFYERFARPMQIRRYALWLTPSSVAYMGGGSLFRPRDFLKFGELFLEHGRWRGTPVISDWWLRESIVARTAPEGEGDRYGYGWHLTNLKVRGKSYDVVSAGGNGGQIMAVIPQLDMALMITAGNYGQFPVWRTFLPRVATAAIESANL